MNKGNVGVRMFLWDEHKVLVTGGTGFLGMHIVSQLLSKGAQVFMIARQKERPLSLLVPNIKEKVTVLTCDLFDVNAIVGLLSEHRIDTVFHAAAHVSVPAGQKDPAAMFASNTQMTWGVLDACRRTPMVKRIVFTSTDKVYGSQKELPYTEEMSFLAKDPYSVSKACADLVAQSYARTYTLPLAITRSGNFYGPGDLHFDRLIPGVVRSFLQNERPVLRSDGSFIRDFLYVEDAAAAHLLVAEQLDRAEVRGEAFNFSPSEKRTVLEVVQSIKEAVGSSLEPDIQNTSTGEIPSQYLSSDKAVRVLGWKATTDFAVGLRKTVDWYRYYFAAEKK
jgi:CDP-glucose 4,6-dehydratase